MVSRPRQAASLDASSLVGVMLGLQASSCFMSKQTFPANYALNADRAQSGRAVGRRRRLCVPLSYDLVLWCFMSFPPSFFPSFSSCGFSFKSRLRLPRPELVEDGEAYDLIFKPPSSNTGVTLEEGGVVRYAV